MTIFYSDMEPLSHYSPIKLLHLSPSTRILNENPEHNFCHTYTLLMLPKWAFQLNRIKKIQIYKLIENVNTIIL